jgi:hypothetical protein
MRGAKPGPPDDVAPLRIRDRADDDLVATCALAFHCRRWIGDDDRHRGRRIEHRVVHDAAAAAVEQTLDDDLDNWRVPAALSAPAGAD